MKSLAYKECIQKVQPYLPGKPIDEVKRELGLKGEIVKIASNENALGPSPKAVAAMKKAATEMHLYPEGGSFYVREKLSKFLNVEPGQLIFGAGSNEIIEFIVKGFLGEGKEVISCRYAFAVYPILTQAYGGKYVEVPMKGFTFDLDGILKAITDNTQIIFITNPNNPTGTMVDRATLEKFIAQVPSRILICIDEAYFEFVEDENYKAHGFYLDKGNVVTLRTFSKIYGLAGVRLGYGIAPENIINYFNRIRQPFNVNAMAQIAGAAAIDDQTHIEKTLAMTHDGRSYLYGEFARLGLTYEPSQANFILVNVGDSGRVFNALLKKGVIVRCMRSYGLPEWIRVTIGTKKENKRFVDALTNVIKG